VTKHIAIIGTGPAALMAASTIAGHGYAVTILEKSKGPGRKLLIAGGSGLNISNSLPLESFISHYKGAINWKNLFAKFSVADWLAFIHKLGLETFEGTSGRFFVREMKASGLLTAWVADLKKRGVELIFDSDCMQFNRAGNKVEPHFSNGQSQYFDAVLFALGGGSWLKEPVAWPAMFTANDMKVIPFTPSNAGFKIAWSEKFRSESENKPLKNIEFISSTGRKKGDVMLTSYGIEGTPVYFCGRAETCFLDLKPDLSETAILEKLDSVSENLSPLRRAKKKLNLDAAALALLFHESPTGALESNASLAALIKKFPLKLIAPQPLEEAISSSGGIALTEITDDFMLNKFPGTFAAGEMLDWDAPTGGFLIQACVSQGFAAAQGILKYLRA
jgi:uncharacterized flavoprotein (TIGR03862 family)